jgi:putative ABC transport system permease protein
MFKAIHDLVGDVRYAIRGLIRSPRFAIIAIVTLALGIGATTIIFSLVYTVLLRPLPFPQQERLVALNSLVKHESVVEDQVSYPDFFDFRSQNHTFVSLASFHSDNDTLTGINEPLHVPVEVVSGDLFMVLGVEPKIGHRFTRFDEAAGNSAIILSDSLWRSQCNSDPTVIGRTVKLDGSLSTIVGVMPPGFEFPIDSGALLWASVGIEASQKEPLTAQRGLRFVDVVGRLKPNIELGQAEADLNTIARGLRQDFPQTNGQTVGVRVTRELDSITASIRPVLLILLMGVGCLLIIACANVANLLLARATVRARELAVRIAVGAEGMRIVRQLATESALLWLLSGVAGLAATFAVNRAVVVLAGNRIPRISGLHVDFRVVLASLGLALVTGVLFGLAPAFSMLRLNFVANLKENGQGTQGGVHLRLRNGFMVSQFAIALILLVAAGLLIETYWRLRLVDPGFRTDSIVSFRAATSSTFQGKRPQFYHELLQRLANIPGVESVAGVFPLPLADDDLTVNFEVKDRLVVAGEHPVAEVLASTPGYLSVVGIPLLHGRDFSDHDDAQAAPVAMVNDAFAKRFFPKEDAIGKSIKPDIAAGGSSPMMRQIVGVVGNVKTKSLRDQAIPQIYLPSDQASGLPLTFVIRSQIETGSLVLSVMRVVRSVDQQSPIYNVETMDKIVDRSLGDSYFNLIIVTSLASIALVLTGVGLYGVVAYAVTQRTREIGLRMALGASRLDIAWIVLGHVTRLALIGSVIGLGVTLAVTRFLQNLLYGVRPLDPLTFVLVILLLWVVALVAAYIPALRASRVDPLVALRYE